MKSIRDLYKVGKGPSSSHTMGPERAARIFKQENPGAERYEVTLYGSLALTGVGHGTDRVLSEVLAPTPTEIIFSKKDPGDLRHPNTLDFAAYKGEEKFASMRVESIGDPLMREIRILDKLVDELAKGKAMEQIMRIGEAEHDRF